MVGGEVRQEQIRSESAREHGEIGELARRVNGHRAEARCACPVCDTAGATKKIERERLVIGPKQGQGVAGKRLHEGGKPRIRVEPRTCGPHCVCRLAGRCVVSEELVGKLASVAEERA